MKNIYLGSSKIPDQLKDVDGKFVEIGQEKFYRIGNFDEMPDFFMTIVSDSDHWMYLSSNGSLTAGRKNRDNALFPYYPVDKIHDYKSITGSRTYCMIEQEDKSLVWEPFTDESAKIYNISRNLYKSIYGNKIIFEEVNHDLDVVFQYGWYNSEKFGWIKKSNVINLGKDQLKINILDGIQNILPSGVDYAFQNEYSNLVDAYKKSELLEESRLGLYMLSSIPVDRAEPSEALRTTTVWSYGLEKAEILISNNQVEKFKRGHEIHSETDVRACRGSYYLHTSLNLANEENKEWYFAAELNQDSADVSDLNQFILTQSDIVDQIIQDIDKGTMKLIQIVANADGLQMTNEELCYARHYSNTLFNIMRGGIFARNYLANTKDFILFAEQTNRKVRDAYEKDFAKLPEKILYSELINWAITKNDPILERICIEYLPLTFSRRHGDPSRPWNLFSIEIKNHDGSDKLNYQGNWRDIFQNWEALGLSFPEYIEGMISKFVNATTADGYNPYRITREGIDWESPEPNDPWAYIGYWGDHQIIYLQKMLEQSNDYHPGKLDEMLTREIYVFANVPYRIKPFNEIINDPKDTIMFDHELNEKIKVLFEETGADGKLLQNDQGQILRTNLTEKILITLLTKLSNFIPEAGIWLTTQRPEWNDANNALVGNGVSMVTLYYLRRFLNFWKEKFGTTSLEELLISEEVISHFNKTYKVFLENTALLNHGFSDNDRYNFARSLGEAGSDYRETIYRSSFSGNRAAVSASTLKEFMELAIKYIDQSISKNKREDGLYHAYNLISVKGESISIRYLYEMLEGQVSVLSSGLLSASESLDVLNKMKVSKLFREDQFSYLLYPDRQLKRFTEKNNIPDERVQSSSLLKKLISGNDTSVIIQDKSGQAHFNSSFRNASILKSALENLDQKSYGALVRDEMDQILQIFEEIFDHQSFTGRSGTFYGYEGLGSIYWHMVSKLLLATQECYFKGIAENAESETLGKIKQHYYEIKAGIGLYKSPKTYGAFPTDAYSHTPGNAGVKQPGLTGQVKEDVISRFGELGIRVSDGKITFTPSLLNRNEILQNEVEFPYFDLSEKSESLQLHSNQLGYTFCQVPIVYYTGSDEKISVITNEGISEYPGNSLPKQISSEIFNRSGKVKRIEFCFTG